MKKPVLPSGVAGRAFKLINYMDVLREANVGIDTMNEITPATIQRANLATVSVTAE
jgi:hypothetical protein